MKCKDGVRIFGIRPELVFALDVANEVYRELGADLVLMSARDGEHSFSSLHYAGCAADLRIRHLGEHKAKRARNMLSERLTDEFDVILEDDHIHVEFQPKRPT